MQIAGAAMSHSRFKHKPWSTGNSTVSLETRAVRSALREADGSKVSRNHGESQRGKWYISVVNVLFHCRLIVACVICLSFAAGVNSDDASEIVTHLKAMSEQGANLDFTIIERTSPIGDGLRHGIASCKKAISILKSRPEDERMFIDNIQTRIKNLQIKQPDDEYQFRVALRQGNEILLTFGRKGRRAGPSSASAFYSGMWHHFFEAPKYADRKSRLPNTEQLVINEQHNVVSPHHVLALGPVPDGYGPMSDVTANLPRDSFAMGWVPWTVFFEILQKKDYKFDAVKLDADVTRLLIQLPPNKLRPGAFRYEVDVYRKHAYCPASFRSYQYIPAVGPKEAYFIGNAQCEWKNPIEVNGLMLPSLYLAYGQQHFPIPSETIPFAYWKAEAIPIGLSSYDIRDVKVNTSPLDQLVPPPATRVYDEVKGINYVIGSAGEALEITANEAARELLPGFKRTSTMMVLIYIAVGAAILILGFFTARYYRRRTLV
jgi:hypothetical protein